eukprot:7051530-Prymnesium_polylepis.1
MFTATRSPVLVPRAALQRVQLRKRATTCGAPTPHIVAALARPPKPTNRHQQRAVRRRRRWR